MLQLQRIARRFMRRTPARWAGWQGSKLSLRGERGDPRTQPLLAERLSFRAPSL